MFSDHQLEDIWCKARDVSSQFPVTYENLFGHERLAVLHVLKEPVQSTLHAILQKNVPPRTKCVYQHCPGILSVSGQCSEKCEQSGVNAVQDIVDCVNCDSHGFPCHNCHCNIFRKQIKQYLEDYWCNLYHNNHLVVDVGRKILMRSATIKMFFSKICRAAPNLLMFL